MHTCGRDPRLDCRACEVEERAAESEWIDDGPEPDEPSPEQEREWDRREDEARGNAIGDRDWMLADLMPPWRGSEADHPTRID